MKPSLSPRNSLLTVLVLALLARLAFLMIFGNSIFFFEKTGQIHGSTAYDDYALNLLETGVYGREAGNPDALIAPAYSYLVAATYALFGRGGLQIGLLHSLLDLITIACVFDIARRLFREGEMWGQNIGVWVGALAGLFTAFYPYLIFQNLTLNDTAFFMAEMHLFIWLMIRLRDAESIQKSLIWALLAGVVLGITTLTRALLPLFAVLTAIWFLYRLSFWQTMLRLVPVAFISLLLLLPWMSRSYQIYDNFVAVALNTGDNLFQGSNPMTLPLFEAGYDVQWSTPPITGIFLKALWQLDKTLDDMSNGLQTANARLSNPLSDAIFEIVENLQIGNLIPSSEENYHYRRNELLVQAGMAYLRENPQKIPQLLWVKFLVHWSIDVTPRNNPLANQRFELNEQGKLLVSDDENANMQDIGTIATYESGLFDTVARPIHILYYGALLMLALLGILLSAKQWREVSLLWFLEISMMVMYLIFHPSTRYRVPTDPLLFVFSAYALLWLFEWWKKSRDRIESTLTEE